MRVDHPLTTTHYVMYFRFCGWRHVCPQWAVWRVAKSACIQSDSPGAKSWCLYNCIICVI